MRFAYILAVAALAGLAGCGDDDFGSDSSVTVDFAAPVTNSDLGPDFRPPPDLTPPPVDLATD